MVSSAWRTPWTPQIPNVPEVDQVATRLESGDHAMRQPKLGKDAMRLPDGSLMVTVVLIEQPSGRVSPLFLSPR